jgi:hypothetical protein
MTFALGLSITPAIAIENPELVTFEDPNSGGWIGIDFDENDHFATSLLTVGNRKTESNYDTWDTKLCSSIADPACQIPDYYFDSTAIFSPCTEAIVTNCVVSLNAKRADGEEVLGKVTRLWNPQGEYKGDSLLGYPDGGQASSWSLPGTNPSGSEKYVLLAGVRGGGPVPQMNSQESANFQFQGQLFIYLQPVVEISGNYRDPKMTLVPRGTGGIGVGGGLEDMLGCFMNDTQTCAQKATFPLDVQYSVTMRFDRPISPWLNGRVVNPSISIRDLGNQGSEMTISANAMRTPAVGGYIKWSDTPEWMKAKYPAGTGGTARSPDGFTTKNLDTRILKTGAGSSGTRAISEFKDWIPFLQDKPYAMKTFWNVRAIRDEPSRKMQDCAQNRFAGIVSSNAAVYSSGAPSWNPDTQTLDYVVGAPHFDTEGKLLTGEYVLSMRSDVARCIYGFTSAPISARVEVASEDGNPNIATTTIKEDRTTGMLTLHASGFHYSVPQLSVKLMQEKSPTPPQASKTKVIICIKGKLKKTVKGASPKCPTGYKKS